MLQVVEATELLLCVPERRWITEEVAQAAFATEDVEKSSLTPAVTFGERVERNLDVLCPLKQEKVVPE